MPEIYVVDDDAAVRNSIVFMLKASGWTARAFSSGGQFLAEAPDLGPGVLLTDLRMPEMDGLQLLAEVRRRRLPFDRIAMSAHLDRDLGARALAAGAAAVLAKPFDVEAAAAAVAIASGELVG